MSIIKSGLLCQLFLICLFLPRFQGRILKSLLVAVDSAYRHETNRSSLPAVDAESIARREIKVVDSYLTWSTEPAVLSLPSAVTEVFALPC